MKANLPFLVICLLAFGRDVSSQSKPAASGAVLLDCRASCPGIALWTCNEERGLYLLRGSEGGKSSCVQAQMDTLKPLVRGVPGILMGIGELDKAIATAPDKERLNLRLFAADARVELSQAYLTAGDTALAEMSMQHAADEYLKIFRDSEGSPDFRTITLQIVTGLIRSGRPATALTVLDHLPASDPERLYLTAEILFSLGARQSAANAYEKWISTGCQSEFSMLSEDEFGRAFVFLPLNKQTDHSKCGQMPQELYERLRGLYGEFQHPSNLPLKNNPMIPIPSREGF